MSIEQDARDVVDPVTSGRAESPLRWSCNRLVTSQICIVSHHYANSTPLSGSFAQACNPTQPHQNTAGGKRFITLNWILKVELGRHVVLDYPVISGTLHFHGEASQKEMEQMSLLRGLLTSSCLNMLALQ